MDLDALQDVVDLGPYQLKRCASCRGVNITATQRRCCWCGEVMAPRAGKSADGSRRASRRKKPRRAAQQSPHKQL
jgi:hypothetical protein